MQDLYFGIRLDGYKNMKKIFRTLILFIVVMLGLFTICSVKTFADEEATEEQAIYICQSEEGETLYVILNGEVALLSDDNETWYETTYKKIDNYLYIYNKENEGEALLFAINDDKTLTPIDHIVPNETPEEEQLGFFESNWDTIVSALLGTTGGLGLLFGIAGLILKRLKKRIAQNEEQAKANGQDTSTLKALQNRLDDAQQGLAIANAKIEELTNKVIENNEQFKTNLIKEINSFKAEIIKEYGDKVITMGEHFEAIMSILSLIANNSDDIVKNGASRLISDLVNEAKKEVENNGEKEELQD